MRFTEQVINGGHIIGEVSGDEHHSTQPLDILKPSRLVKADTECPPDTVMQQPGAQNISRELY